MERPIILLQLPGSPLAGRIARRLGEAGVATRLGCLDAPLSGAAVTVRAGGVSWEGAELLEAGAVWVEAPLFPWPQSLPPPDPPPAGLTPQDWAVRQREARALAGAALFCAAEARPVVNHPLSAHLAASPAIALDRLARAGLPVHPWRLGAAAPGTAPALDAAGRDRWHAPSRPPAGATALMPAPFAGPVESLLVVGGRLAARSVFADAAAWARGEAHPALAAAAADPAARDLAAGAASALALDLAAVSLHAGAVLLCEAAPDLAAWDEAAAGAVAAAIAELLLTRASAPALAQGAAS